MAVFPCDWVAHRYREQQQSAYVTIADGVGVGTHKMRLCPKHFEEFHQIACSSMNPIDSDMELPPRCEKCGGPRAETIFAKTYRLHEEPDQLAVELCAPCGAALTNRLRIGNGKPL